jgi:hypothetical protein
MSPEYEKKLEERIHQELAKLPERPAPANFAAAVMARIEQRAARPWWRKPIPQWPRSRQMLCVGLMLACLAGALVGLNAFWPHEAIQELPAQAAAAMEPVRPVWAVVEALTHALALLVSSLSQPWLMALGAGFLFVYVSCIGMGMAWYRVTFQKDFHRTATH